MSAGGPFVVEVVGAERVDASLDPARRWAHFPQAMYHGGLAIEREMKVAAKPHHDTGNLERNIHTNPPIGTGLNVTVSVGINTATAPEGRPLAFGWASKSGRQPPVEPIIAWLTRKGGGDAGFGGARSQMAFRPARSSRMTVAEASATPAIRQRAFLIARAIGRRGYRFGRTDWFHDGIRAGRPKLEAIMRAAIRGQVPR